jgi:hypothetical protein
MAAAEIRGREQLAGLGKRLKTAGDPARGLRMELLRGIRAAAVPAVKDAHEAARSMLPKAGGLNERVAKEPISVRTRLTGASVGVRITTTATDTRGANRGTWRHPVFGKWLPKMPAQVYEPAKGWYDDTLEKHRPEVTTLVLMSMRLTAEKITRVGF